MADSNYTLELHVDHIQCTQGVPKLKWVLEADESTSEKSYNCLKEKKHLFHVS